MKKLIRLSVFRRISALALAAALALPTVYATAGEHKLETVLPIMEGLDYINVVSEHPEAGRVEGHILELDSRSKAYPIMVQGSGSIYGAASINKAVEVAQNEGYHVLGAINTDYFSVSNGVPMGIVIEDGVYKSSSEGRDALTITDGEFGLADEAEVVLTLTNERTGESVEVDHLNKWRAPTGGTYLLNEDFSTVSTRTATPGWMVRMVQENEDDVLTVDGEMTLYVTELVRGTQAPEIGEDNYIFTSDDKNGLGKLYESFQMGDEITLTTQCLTPELEEADWASGIGDVMIRDGELTDSSQWIHIKEGRAPRTALGVRRDGSAVLYVADGRRSSHSGGLSQLDLAEELLKQDCEWAVNLDGGGSSAMTVWRPGQPAPAIVNRPSDGKPRGCGTYLVLVTDQAGSGRPERLALKNDGLLVLTGTSVNLGDVMILDEGLNVLDTAEERDEVRIVSQDELGEIEDNVYTAGNEPGTDTLYLRSRELGTRGIAHIHVVDTLTELTLTGSGSDKAVTELHMKPGEQIALDAKGSYWNRIAMRDQSGVTWEVTGDIGTMDESGLFTAGKVGGASGTITARAGGLSVTVPVTLKNLHEDVPADHWAYQAVDYCYEKGLVSGISDKNYGPNEKIRRGDFMLMLYRAAGSPAVTQNTSFPDVSESDYYAEAISWALENGLASGMQDGTFAPKINVTREQTFTILNRALPIMGIHCDPVSTEILNQFSDRSSMSVWAEPHAATLIGYHFVGGSDGKINPKGNLTRAEMAVLLYKMGTYDPSTAPKPDMPADPSVATGLTISEGELVLDPLGRFQLEAKLQPETAEGYMTWTMSSSVPGVAYVDSTGLVTNLNASGAPVQVTVTVSSGKFSASCAVTCLPALDVGLVSDGAAALNVRSGPGTDCEVLDRISEGMSVIVEERLDGGWLRVRYLSKSGAAAFGYVSQDYITPGL